MKRFILGAVVAATLMGGVMLLYARVFPSQETAPTWLVSTYTGVIEVSLAGGAWTPAELHQPLSDGDRVRAAAASDVTLIHGESHVTIKEQTQVEMAQLNADHSRFELTEGQVFVEARGDSVGMRSRAGASMETTNAGVGMTVRADGWTQVKVSRGEVDFTANDRIERVKAGEESHASVGGGPSKPVRIPDVLLLNVQFPDADTFNSRVARVEGKADPGSRVMIGNKAVEVSGDGTFATDVALDEGINQIEVAATDSIGNTRNETSQPIRVDTTAPSLEGATIGSRAVTAPHPGQGG